MQSSTILFSIDPEHMCIIVSDGMGEDELQAIRTRFKNHKIVSCCSNHAPAGGFAFVPVEMLLNAPPCAVILTPDDDWNISSL